MARKTAHPHRGAASAMLASLALASMLGSCASVPEFKPSRPVAEAQGLQEGLFLCHEYRIPQGRSRPAAMKPYLDCVGELASLDLPAGRLTSFETFKQELELLYKLQREELWDAHLAEQVDSAVQVAFRAQWSYPAGRYTRREKSLIHAFFPRTADRVEAQSWRPAEEVAIDPPLERLKARVSALPESNREIWKELLSLDATYSDLMALGKLSPGDPRVVNAERRYRARIRALGDRVAQVQGSGEHARN